MVLRCLLVRSLGGTSWPEPHRLAQCALTVPAEACSSACFPPTSTYLRLTRTQNGSRHPLLLYVVVGQVCADHASRYLAYPYCAALPQPTNWPANVCLGVSETSFVCADASPVVQLHSFEWVEPAAAKARQAHATPARADTLQSTWQLSEVWTSRLPCPCVTETRAHAGV